MKVTFIPDEQLGVVFKASAVALLNISTIRKRKAGFNRVVASLRSVGILTSEPVVFIAEGTSSAGRLGLFIGQEVMGAGLTSYGGSQDGQTGT